MALQGYTDVHVIGDGGTFTLQYTPTRKDSKPKRLMLEATNEDDARYEAARVLWCGEDELPAIEWL